MRALRGKPTARAWKGDHGRRSAAASGDRSAPGEGPHHRVPVPERGLWTLRKGYPCTIAGGDRVVDGRLPAAAVARLMLDNIAHIKAYWVMMTPRIAQIALRFGADDLDGTVIEEKIYHDAGATPSQSLRRGELLQLIRKAGREPVERDTLYRPVTRTETAFTVLV